MRDADCIEERLGYYEENSVDELIEAKEKGLLFTSPCKVGDTVYAIIPTRNIISEMIVEQITIRKNDFMGFTWKGSTPDTVYPNVEGFSSLSLGKTVFLTRKEAEIALEKLNRRF
jgi:hypothetical protein